MFQFLSHQRSSSQLVVQASPLEQAWAVVLAAHLHPEPVSVLAAVSAWAAAARMAVVVVAVDRDAHKAAVPAVGMVAVVDDQMDLATDTAAVVVDARNREEPVRKDLAVARMVVADTVLCTARMVFAELHKAVEDTVDVHKVAARSAIAADIHKVVASLLVQRDRRQYL